MGNNIMPVTINGTSGVVTGISVGGLPDGIVDADMFATKTFTSYAIIGDKKSDGTYGGTFTLGAWRTRDLNSELADPDGIVSINSNQFTLQAGTYLVKASAPAYAVVRHQTRLYNATDSTTIEVGTTEQSHISYITQTRSFISARFTLSGAKALEIQHYASHTNADDGFGYASNFGVSELYTVVEIYKEA